ncbi:YaaC family protein [Streptomyces albidoflavus]
MYMKADPEEAWGRLRASRANPPGKAGGGARRRTYAAALEQAEQMFRAAAVVGPATRPLQVFYGLSQAGRAIAAAAVDLKGEDWRLYGHGIKASGFDKPFADIEIRTNPATSRASFVRLSHLLNSPVWGKGPVRLEDSGTYCQSTSSARSRTGTGTPPSTRTIAASTAPPTLCCMSPSATSPPGSSTTAAGRR